MRRFALPLLFLTAALPARLSAGVERWTPLGPDEGVVLSLAVDPQNPDIVYAGTRTAGVFRSADGGRSWVPARRGLLSAQVNCLAIDPQTPSTLYACNFWRVFKSTDRGATWKAAAPGRRWVNSLAIDPQAPETLFAATILGVYRSRDGAATWERLTGGLPYGVFSTVLVDPDRPRIVYALHEGGQVFRSADGGESWAMRSPRPSPVTVLAMDPLRPAILYAETAGMLYKTFDGGTSWSRVRESGHDIFQNLHLAVASLPGRTILYAGAALGLWRSDDGGQTWKYLAAPGGSAVTALAAAPSSETVFAATRSRGLARSGDLGNHWAPANEGLFASPVLGLALDPVTSTDLYVMAGTAGEDYLGRYSLNDSRPRGSREAGAIWDELRPWWSTDRFHGPICFDPGDPGRLLLVERGLIVRLPLDGDAGAEWIDGPEPSCSILLLAPDPAAPDILYAGNGWEAGHPCAQDTFRSADGGVSWRPLGVGRPIAMAFDPLRPARRYLSALFGLFVTDDGGETWQIANSPPEGTPQSLLIPPGAPDLLYAGTDPGVFLSHDGTATWEPTGFLPQRIVALASDPRSPSRLYAGAEGSGVFASEDGGATWFAMSEGLVPETFSGPLVVDPQRPQRLYAGTRAGLFAWTRREPSTCVNDEETLCLAGGRFQARLRWKDEDGRRRAGRALHQNTFALGRPGEPEVAVKTVPAAVGGFVTLYVAGLTDREYVLDVLDTTTGDFRTYFKGAGQLSSRRDVRAFPAATQSAAAAPEPYHIGPRFAFFHGRFKVEVAWQRRGDGSGQAYARFLPGSAAAFGFTSWYEFDVFVRVDDRRRRDGHFWVSFAGLTTAGYTVRVTDVLTGAVRAYASPPGKLTSLQDREAF